MVEQEAPVYAPGETISFELTFTHKMKIMEVYATLAYNGEGDTNTPAILMRRARPGKGKMRGGGKRAERGDTWSSTGTELQT